MDMRAHGYWAVILGGSSGFGLAAAKKLARMGLHICIVHRDRKGAMARIEEGFAEIRSLGVTLLTHNCDALAAEGRTGVVASLLDSGVAGKVRVLLHSIAFGSVRGIVPSSSGEPFLDEEELARTIHAMGSSLLTWTQDLYSKSLFAKDARVFGLTSEGNEVAWHGYGAVSAAKGVLEAMSRSIAKEFAPHGIRANILQPGVTDTPALRLIPGSDGMIARAIERNPFHRLTTPEDVADVIGLLATDEARWINGSLIRVDGGERIGG